MNQLSWLLYWADVLPSISTWLAIVSFLLFVISLGLVIIGLCAMSDAGTIDKVWDQDQNKGWIKTEKINTNAYKTGAQAKTIGMWLAPVFFLLWGASFMVPEKETFYLIAGSEAGEQAIQTPEFDKVRKVINKYLDDNLDTSEKSVNDSTEEKK